MKNTTFESAKNSSSFAHVCMTVCVALMSIMTSNTIIAQDVKREGKVYVEQKKSSEAKSEEKTGFTYKDAKGVSFDIYIGKTGSCYINKVSKNGNKYRKYLGEEISREICQSLGRKYQPKSK